MEDKSAQALRLYKSLIKYLESKNYKFHRDDEKMFIVFYFSSNDIPISYYVSVDPDHQLLVIDSLLTCKFNNNKINAVISANLANVHTLNGAFIYYYNEDTMCFRVTSSFINSLLSEQLFEYMISIVHTTVDRYNDKFEDLANGKINLDEFSIKTGIAG